MNLKPCPFCRNARTAKGGSMTTAAERLANADCTDVVIFENPDYDDALIGVTSDNRAVYDFDRMVACLVGDEGMTAEDAVEFIEYNTIRALPYIENAPVIVYGLEVDE